MKGYRDEELELDNDFDDAREEARPLVASTRLSTTRSCKPLSRGSLITLVTVSLLCFAAFLIVLGIITTTVNTTAQCYDSARGYQCHSEISHYWGQYSPFFSVAEVDAEISPAIPADCTVTFVQALSRHGARYPTAHKSKKYAKLVKKIQRTAIEYNDTYAVLKDYKYTLGADILTSFGEQQMIDSGAAFYRRYEQLAKHNTPFMRASGSARVIASGELFGKGFNALKDSKSDSNQTQPASKIDLVIPEGHQYNNTLSTGTCSAYSDGSPVKKAQKEFLKVFAPSILERFVANMPGVELRLKDIPRLMDLCPFETVAQNQINNETTSSLCSLFTHSEWQSYDYYNTLGKYYGYGSGHPLGSTRGAGYVNEVIARMTKSRPVNDHTSVNHTLDSDPTTFPLDTALYADFTHDNAMASIFAAFGLYNSTKALSTAHVQSAAQTDGYAASWLVPFGARAYIEMMQCSSSSSSSSSQSQSAGESDEPFVRVLVNDRVVPLHGCDVDALGRCRRDDWINGLSYISNGGRWADYCPRIDDELDFD